MPTEEDQLVFDHSRTVSWTSTGPFHPQMAKMSGREVLEAIQAGLLAPPLLARVIGFHIVGVGDGQGLGAARGSHWSRAGILRIWPAPFTGAWPPRCSTMRWARR